MKNFKNIELKKTLCNKHYLITTTIFSIFFSLMLMLQVKINYHGDAYTKFKDNNMIFENFNILDIVKLLIFFVIVYAFLTGIYIIYKAIENENNEFNKVEKSKDENVKAIEQIKKSKDENVNTIKQIKKNKKEEKSKKDNVNKINIKQWIKYFLILIAFYFVFFLINYPGFVDWDSFYQIYQYFGIIKYNNHHPIIHTMILGLCMNIGKMQGNYNNGVAIYSIGQMVIITGCISYFIAWLKSRNVSKGIIAVTIIYYALNTIFASYNIIMWKDPLFSIFLFLYMIKLYEIIESKGEILKNKKTIISIIILNILVAFFRNNGIYIVGAISVILLIKYLKNAKLFNIINIISILFILIITGPIFRKYNLKTETKEYYGIAIQQMAYVISTDGKISEEDKQFLYKLLPENEWKNSYEPFWTDSTKDNKKFSDEFLESHRSEFVEVWKRIILENPIKCTKAYLLATYGFWSLGTSSQAGFSDNFIDTNLNIYDIHNTNIIKVLTGIDLTNAVTPKIQAFPGSGSLAWLLLISIYILIANRRTKYIISLLPALLTWGTIMIATPVAFSLRYVFILAYALPFIIIVNGLASKNKIDK